MNDTLSSELSSFKIELQNIFPIKTESDCARVALTTGKKASEYGFKDLDCHLLEVVASELASNIFFHAGSGNMSIALVTGPKGKGMYIEAEDHGSGINKEQLNAILEGNVKAPHGLGIGLSIVKRNMSEFEIQTSDRGTTVRTVKWL